MKTRNIKRRKQYTKKRGGSKNACKIPKGRNAQPTPIEYNGKESEIPEKSYHKLSEAISDVPNDNFIVLKVGSNDSNEVVSGKYSGKVNNINYGQSFGSKGKEGHHYIEISREKSDISEIKNTFQNITTQINEMKQSNETIKNELLALQTTVQNNLRNLDLKDNDYMKWCLKMISLITLINYPEYPKKD